jgi:O-antigen/teichoic acid export membrane protein
MKVTPRSAAVQRLGRLNPVRALASETRALVQDSFVLTLATMVATLGQMAQIALMTNFLGLRAYGQFALAVASVAIASRFFDVQVGSAAIAFAAKTPRDARATAAVFQFSYLVDTVAGIAGYAVVAALAPVIADRLIGPGGSTLFFVYGLTLLTATVETTSLALLQHLQRFSTILWLTVFRELVRVALLVGVLVLFDTLTSAAIALVVVEAAFCVAALATSNAVFRRHHAIGLLEHRSRLAAATRRSMLGMIFHTNFIAYAKLVSSQVPTILLGVLRSPVDVGAFKVATALAAGVGKPADPAWAAVLPRLSRLWNERRIAEVRTLLAQSTILAFGILATGAAAVVLLRHDLIRLFAGRSAPTAVDVLLLAVAAQVISGTLFWNSALLVAARRANLASRSYVASALLLLVLLPVMINAFGAVGAAGALLASAIAGNVLLTTAALALFRARPDRPPSLPSKPVEEA